MERRVLHQLDIEVDAGLLELGLHRLMMVCMPGSVVWMVLMVMPLG